MNIETLKAEFDADFASMTQEQLIASLEEAGFTMVEPWLESELEEGTPMEVEGVYFMSCADANELALAA